MRHSSTACAGARRELEAAALLLRQLPCQPDVACPHVVRAWVRLGRPDLDAGVTEALGRVRLAADAVEGQPAVAALERDVWSSITALREQLNGNRGPTRGGLVTVAVVVLAMALGALALGVHRATDPGVQRISWHPIHGRLGDQPPLVVDQPGEVLAVDLGSMWTDPTIELWARHRKPCRLTLVRGGREVWTTSLAPDPDSIGWSHHVVSINQRAIRLGYQSLVLAPEDSDDPLVIGGLVIGSAS